MKKIILYACLSISLIAGINDKTYGNYVVEEVTSVYDGDTFRVNIAGVDAIIGERIPIRVSGIDTPEIKGTCHKERTLAREAKMFVVEKLRAANKIELRNIRRGKYFRIVADVYIDGKSLSEMVIKNNFGVRYNGGKKVIDWCR